MIFDHFLPCSSGRGQHGHAAVGTERAQRYHRRHAHALPCTGPVRVGGHPEDVGYCTLLLVYCKYRFQGQLVPADPQTGGEEENMVNFGTTLSHTSIARHSMVMVKYTVLDYSTSSIHGIPYWIPYLSWLYGYYPLWVLLHMWVALADWLQSLERVAVVVLLPYPTTKYHP